LLSAPSRKEDEGPSETTGPARHRHKYPRCFGIRCRDTDHGEHISQPTCDYALEAGTDGCRQNKPDPKKEGYAATAKVATEEAADDNDSLIEEATAEALIKRIDAQRAALRLQH
jgi:hypothetical protein